MSKTEESLRVSVLVRPDLPLGAVVNTAAVVSVGLAAHVPALAGTVLRDSADRMVLGCSEYPVPILQADSATLQAVVAKACQAAMPEGAAVVPFPAFARRIHTFADYQRELSGRDLTSEELDGVGLVGPEKWVRSLTGALKLLR